MHCVRLKSVLAGVCLAFLMGPAAASDAIQWQTSFKAAISKAKHGNKLVMVDFYADW